MNRWSDSKTDKTLFWKKNRNWWRLYYKKQIKDFIEVKYKSIKNEIDIDKKNKKIETLHKEKLKILQNNKERLDAAILEKQKYKRNEERAIVGKSMTEYKKHLQEEIIAERSKSKKINKNKPSVTISRNLSKTNNDFDIDDYFNRYENRARKIEENYNLNQQKIINANLEKEKQIEKGKQLAEKVFEENIEEVAKKYIVKILKYDEKKTNKNKELLQKIMQNQQKKKERMKDIKDRIKKSNSEFKENQMRLKQEIEEKQTRVDVNKTKKIQNYKTNILKSLDAGLDVKENHEQIKQDNVS